MRGDLVVQRNLDNFLVFNIVELAGVILKHGRVTSHYLEEVFVFFSLRRKNIALVYLFYFKVILLTVAYCIEGKSSIRGFRVIHFQVFGNSYHHSSCVFDDVHTVRFQN